MRSGRGHAGSRIRACAAAAAVLLAVARAAAQNPDPDPPAVGQPAAFSGIVGRVRVEASVEPAKAAVEEPLVFAVRILGDAGAKHFPRRQGLKVFPEDVERDFWVEPMPDRDRVAPGLWEFGFRLKAKRIDVKETPPLKLVYFHPDRKKYQTTFADPIALEIVPPPPPVEPPPSPRVLRVPQLFLEPAPLPAGLQSATGSWRPGIAFWIAALAAPPLACVAALWALGKWRPDASERRRRAMHGAALRASAALKRVAADDAARSVDAVRRYLAERFGWAPSEPGPHETEAWLKRRGIAAPVRRQVAAFLAEWDRCRFGPSVTAATAWPSRADALVQAVEDDPCVRLS